MHLAAARDVERIRALLRHMQGDILEELALQAVHKLGIGAIGALRTMNRGPRYANDFWITDMPDAVAGALEEILLRS